MGAALATSRVRESLDYFCIACKLFGNAADDADDGESPCLCTVVISILGSTFIADIVFDLLVYTGYLSAVLLLLLPQTVYIDCDDDGNCNYRCVPTIALLSYDAARLVLLPYAICKFVDNSC